MKVKSAEQYKALRKRELAKKHKRARKTRHSDNHGWSLGALFDDFGPYGMGKYVGHHSKPNHSKRAVDINGVFKAASNG
jgi:hypothetical protein